MQITHVPFDDDNRSLRRISCATLPAVAEFLGTRLCSVISTAVLAFTSAIIRSGLPPTPLTPVMRSPLQTSIPVPLAALIAFQSWMRPSRTSLTSKYFAFLQEDTVKPNLGGDPVKTWTLNTRSSSSSGPSCSWDWVSIKSYATRSITAARVDDNRPYSRDKLSDAQTKTSAPCSTIATRTISLSACICSDANSRARPSHLTAARTTSLLARNVSEANCKAKPSLATAAKTTSLFPRNASDAYRSAMPFLPTAAMTTSLMPRNLLPALASSKPS
mmetsp:Transcript_32684/g.74701  ORF Transcript_32684/g.74701 Transcript_32684/m.74701 type:complete len:274 (+) Transcript_32684:81-902(+)